MSAEEFPLEYTLDPDGDVFLILTDQVEDSNSDNACKDDENDTSQRETHDPSLSLTDEAGHIKSDNTCEDDENDTSQGEIRVQCSSKHLSLASPVFKAMLSNDFKEGATLQSMGTLRLPLPGDDPAALLVLLNIIHGQTEETPLQVDLCMLTRIAILVDKYRLHKAVKIFSRIWIGRVEVSDAQGSMKDINRWIFVSWVFKWPTEFKIATQMAERTTDSRIDASEGIHLPIPCLIVGQQYLGDGILIFKLISVADAIDQNRQRALSEIITELHSILEKYQGPGLTCNVRCDAIVLGTLTKSMKSMQLPEPPYSKLSFDILAESVGDMNILTDCEFDSCPHGVLYRHHGHLSRATSCQNRVKDMIKVLIEKIKVRLCGLDLDSVGSK